MRWTWTWNSTPVDAQVLLFNKRYPSTCLAQNPLVNEHGNWQSPIRGGFNGKIIYKLKIFHCHVWFPAGTFQMTFFRSLGWYINTSIHIYIYIYTYRYIHMYRYTLRLFNIAMENGPFIDGLPVKNGDFHGYVSHNQRVYAAYPSWQRPVPLETPLSKHLHWQVVSLCLPSPVRRSQEHHQRSIDFLGIYWDYNGISWDSSGKSWALYIYIHIHFGILT